MVKSSRPGAHSFELNSQVNSLASQFSNSVCLGDEALQALNNQDHQKLKWGSTSSTSSTLGYVNPDVDAAMSVNPIPAETQPGVQVPRLKCSALGFEVDLSGSQNSETPFLRLRPRVGPFVLPVQKGLPDLSLKRREERFKKRRIIRRRSSGAVCKLLHAARKRLVTDLSLMVPGSIEQIKSADPSGKGELNWSVLQSWLEKQPDLKAQMNLTTKALHILATYNGPSLEAKSLQSLKLYAVVVCRLESDTYKGLCSFLFPEDNRFTL